MLANVILRRHRSQETEAPFISTTIFKMDGRETNMVLFDRVYVTLNPKDGVKNRSCRGCGSTYFRLRIRNTKPLYYLIPFHTDGLYTAFSISPWMGNFSLRLSFSFPFTFPLLKSDSFNDT